MPVTASTCTGCAANQQPCGCRYVDVDVDVNVDVDVDVGMDVDVDTDVDMDIDRDTLCIRYARTATSARVDLLIPPPTAVQTLPACWWRYAHIYEHILSILYR